ncbi:MAG: hypothetical protein V2B20_24785 [Pseudomonadota bacterium]
MLTTKRTELEKFLIAFRLSWLLFSQNKERLDLLFLKESNSTSPLSVLDVAASIEPNIHANNLSYITMDFSEDDFKVIDEAVNYLLDRKIITDKINPRNSAYIDLSPLKTAFKGTNVSNIEYLVRIKD